MKRGILLVAYGSGNLRGTAALRAVQSAAEARFGLPVRWAYTSDSGSLEHIKVMSKTLTVSAFSRRSEYWAHPVVCSYVIIRLAVLYELSAVSRDELGLLRA